MTLLLASPWSAELWLGRFKTCLSDRDVVTLDDAVDRESIRYAAVWGRASDKLAGLPNLQAIFSLGAGVDHLMSGTALPDVPIIRVAHDDLTNRMSEYVVMQCLMHLRRQRSYEDMQRRKVWKPDPAPPGAADVRIGVMGFGVLGEDAARKLRMMGFDVAGWTRSPKHVEGFTIYAGESGLDVFLSRSDILVALLPLTEETRGILNKRLFQRLAKDGALGGPILVNAGRGGLHVEADILDALEDGTLAAASLDVFEHEPLPEHSRLWSHPHVYVTPHNAATSDPSATARYIADQIRRHEAGEPFQNLVDRTRGY
jgi:glyoxylate/hydroxypyruvate reductase A